MSNPFRSISYISLLAAITLLPSAAQAQGESSGQEKVTAVVSLLKSIETGEQGPAAVINAKKYTQHNLGVADGLVGFGALLKTVPAHSAKGNTVRGFSDGDFVFAHTDYNFFGPKIGFDIFRFEKDKIVEHWDNLQTTGGPNPSGHSMIDGPTEVADTDRTADNKELVENFVKDILVAGKMDKLPHYFDGDAYTQHNPSIGDGLSGLGNALAGMKSAGITMAYSKIHRVLGQGNFVLVVSEGNFSGKHTAFYDLFRVEKGKIAEHWDTIETISAKKLWKNKNGKF